MNDNFDLRKFLVESKSIENMNPIFRKLNENTENTQPSDSNNDPLFQDGIHYKSEYKMKGIPRPTIIIPFAIEGQKTIWYRHKDDKKKKKHTMSLDMFLEKYELHTPLNENNLRAKIREMVLNELGGGEDYDLESRKQEYGINPELNDEEWDGSDADEYFFNIDAEDEDELYEAKKDDEDLPADDAELDPDMAMDAEMDAPEDELTAAASGATGDAKELINHLMTSLDTAKAMGNEKLTTQILNTLKFAIDQSMAQ